MANSIKRSFVINLACTGAVSTRSMSPHVPIRHDEIVADVAACLELGVQMFHLHARDGEGAHTGDPEPYGRLIEVIRKLPGGKEAVLCVTASGRTQPDFESRARVLDLDGDMKPDMASLTLGSLNFMQSASVNAPDTIRRLAERMRERDIRPELEIFDVGMARFAQVLVREGVLDAPGYANVLFGNISSAQPTPLDVAAVLGALPQGFMVSIAGLGRFQLAANLLGLLYVDGVRVGLEDNLWYDSGRSVMATNAALVQRVLRLAEEMERPLISCKALRTQIGLRKIT